jgi:hypothetical protein
MLWWSIKNESDRQGQDTDKSDMFSYFQYKLTLYNTQTNCKSNANDFKLELSLPRMTLDSKLKKEKRKPWQVKRKTGRKEKLYTLVPLMTWVFFLLSEQEAADFHLAVSPTN